MKKRHHIISLCFLIILFIHSGCSSTTSGPASKIVVIESGSIMGTVEDGVETFLGIPYAAPPTGELRWKVPQRVESWSGIRSTTAFGNACPQPDIGLDYGEANEDCLYLNVWAPETISNQLLPVMVWIHGGAFVVGSGSYHEYDGKNLASTGVVVVTINYRLGPLGFLAHPALSAESEDNVSGNYGLLDQIAALEWVKRNILMFGGDPDNVTIFGESAGSVSVTMLMISPLAEGLFDRAIAESGTPMLLRYYYPNSDGTLEGAEQTGVAFVTALGCDQTADVLTCMRGKSSDDLIKTAAFNIIYYSAGPFDFYPIIDGWVIPDDPVTLYASGDIHDVPLIIGTNADEASVFLSSASSLTDYENWVELVFKNDAAAVLSQYPATEEDYFQVFDRVFTIALFTQPARFVSKSMMNKTSKGYLYQFIRTPPTEAAKKSGAYHGIEIPYVFGNLIAAEEYDSIDFNLSKSIMAYWTNMASSGDPNGDDLANWPEYDNKDQNLQLGDTITVNSNLLKDDCDFFENLLGNH